jgi:lysozyme family protein
MNDESLPQAAWDWLLRAEGAALSDDPADRGGRSRYGIAETHHRAAWAEGPPSAAQARAIYARDYWRAYHCHELPLARGLLLLDLLVQHPPRVAAKLWQRSVGAQADGLIGPNTLRQSRAIDTARLHDRYFRRRALHYHAITLANASQARFLDGWFARLFRLHGYVQALAP